jgi:polyisoprenoid-binding protein YceI
MRTQEAGHFRRRQVPDRTYKSQAITLQGRRAGGSRGRADPAWRDPPLTLTINKFKCIQHPMHKKEVCGADASA